MPASRCCPASACAVVCDAACGEVVVIEHDSCCGTIATGERRDGGTVETARGTAPVAGAPQVASEPSVPAPRPDVEAGVPDLRPVEPVSATVDPAAVTPPAVTAAPQEPTAPEPAPSETATAPAEPEMPPEPEAPISEPEEPAPVEPVVAAPDATESEEEMEPEEEMEEEPAVTEPAVEPEPIVPAVPEDPAPVQPAVEPAEEMDEEENLFEELDEAPAAAVPAVPAADDDLFGEPPAPAPAPPPATGQSLEDILGEDAPATDAVAEPRAEPAVSDAAPEAGDVPAADVPATDDANPFPDDARHRPGEPTRRWIDNTGRYATVGVLVAVHADAVELRKQDGRTVRVPFGRLSDHDRGYALEAGARIAARSAPTPRPVDTAGL